jgi:hypothetical protein
MAEAEGGKLVGRDPFLLRTRIPTSYFDGGYWRSWSEFQAELGFIPNPISARIPDDVLLDRYAGLAIELNRLPGYADIRVKKKQDSSFPCYDAFNRLGLRDDFLMKLEKFCEGKAEFAAVTALLERRRAHFISRQRSTPSRGFVYLARRGEILVYELGRVRATGNRLQREALRMSCRTDTVHVIDTDDPEGIERYWRCRFKSRRLGRKYFRLLPEDINAFRRRRYQ